MQLFQNWNNYLIILRYKNANLHCTFRRYDFSYEKLRNNKSYNEIEKYKEITSDLVKDILQEAAKN